MKAVVAAFNQEKALVGAFSVITNLRMELFEALFYSTVAKNQISWREVNGRLVLEGIIKVYWGTEASVRLKEWDDARVISRGSARSRKVMSVGPDFASTSGQGFHYIASQFCNLPHPSHCR